MDIEIPWWYTSFIVFGTFLGGIGLVILGALLQIGGILPEIEILLQIFLRVFIISYIIRGLIFLIVKLCISHIPFSLESIASDIIIALGGVAGASAWILLVAFILNSIITYVGMNLWIVASAVGLTMIFTMYKLTD